MQLRYIYDAAGNKEAVIIPIGEWEQIKQMNNLTEEESQTTEYSVRSFFGIMEDQKEEWIDYLQ